MAKIYSKAELQEKSKAIFNENKSIKKLYATNDGQFFYKQNPALLHASSSKLNVYEIEKGEQAVLNKLSKDYSATTAIAWIFNKIDSVEAVKEFIEGDARKTVIEAAKERIEDLEETKDSEE